MAIAAFAKILGAGIVSRDSGVVVPATGCQGERPKLSVVIPSYNNADLFERAIASVAHLGIAGVEIVLVDDGSTDETVVRGPAAASRHGNVIYLRKPNGGLSSARNHGIAHCTGEYIALLDADDEFLPCDLSAVLAQGADMIRIGVQEEDECGNVRRHVEVGDSESGPDYLRHRFEARTFYTPSWAYIYRRAWLEAAGLSFRPGLIHEDNLFTVQALLAARTVVVHQALVYRYIRRAGSITKATDVAKLQARMSSLALICRELTAMANRQPDVDLRWWIDQTVHNAAALAQQIGTRSARIRAIWIHLAYMIRYQGFQRPGFRFIQRNRLRTLLFGYR